MRENMSFARVISDHIVPLGNYQNETHITTLRFKKPHSVSVKTRI